MTDHDKQLDQPLLSLRAASILALAVLCGIGTGLLLAWAGLHPGVAITTGVGASAGAVAFFNMLIGTGNR
jgi:hypothetical protein